MYRTYNNPKQFSIVVPQIGPRPSTHGFGFPERAEAQYGDVHRLTVARLARVQPPILHLAHLCRVVESIHEGLGKDAL